MTIKTAINYVKNNIILPAAASAAILFGAQQAYAQGYVPTNQEPTTATRNADDYIDGRVRIGGRYNNRDSALIGEGNLTVKPLEDFRIGIDSFSQIARYDEKNGAEDLEVLTNRGLFSIGGSPTRTRSFELFLKGAAGYEWNDFSKAVNMDADRFIYGGQLGLASQDLGSRLLFSLFKGNGEADYELLSGFKGKGDFNTWYFDGEFRQLLSGNQTNGSSFNLNDELKHAVYLELSGFLRDDKYADLQHAKGWGLRLAVPINLQQGSIGWGIRPYLAFQRYNTTSDLSLRETDADKYVIGVDGRLTIDQWFEVFAGLNWTFENIKTTSPGQSIHGRKEDENGPGFVLGVGANF